jgi:hypothetical protein
MATYPDISPNKETAATGAGCTAGTYSYCVKLCPTGFVLNNNACITNTSMDDPYQTLVFDFHKPAATWTNSSAITSASTFKAEAKLQKTSGAGHPAYKRGVYFAGDTDNESHVEVTRHILNHSFSVHSWVLAKSLSANITLYYKDRGFTGTTRKNHLSF